MLVANAQHKVTGKIVSAETQKPIPSASVFFSNTSKGSSTNDQGLFTIENIPDGRFDLVVSCLGYETSVQTVQPSLVKEPLLIKLKPKVAELQEVVVGGYVKETWERWGKFFLDNFIGQTSYAADCTIKNTASLQFRNYKKEGILKVFSDETLEIENKALGYHIHYSLELFQYNFKTKILLYQGYPLFEEMETKRNGLKKRWTEKREKVYHGSNMHFMRSLYRNTLAQEGFEVRKLVKEPNIERQRVQAISKRAFIKKGEGKYFTMERTKEWTDSSAYYNEVLHQPEEKDIVDPQLLNGDSIAYAIDSVTAGLEFANYLRITYTLNKEDQDFLNMFHLNRQPMAPVSTITLPNNKGIAIISNGQFFNSLDLLNSGYWAWSEKMGTMLPFDYWPSKKK